MAYYVRWVDQEGRRVEFKVGTKAGVKWEESKFEAREIVALGCLWSAV
ncbi:hypothetical protein [Helicobacter labacensis]|nr:hypothetical protein [Helicobacter labacensis]